MNSEPRNIEMYYLLAICLMVISIIGVFHARVFEVFEVRATQTVLYALTAISLVGFAELFRRDLSLYTKVLGIFYGVLTILGVMLAFHSIPLLAQFSLSGSNNFLHLFIASILLYLSTGQSEEAIRI